MKYKPGIIIKKENVDCDVVKINEDSIVDPGKGSIVRGGVLYITDRCSGNLSNKSYFLNPNYDWQIVLDSEKQPVLIQTRKCLP